MSYEPCKKSTTKHPCPEPLYLGLCYKHLTKEQRGEWSRIEDQLRQEFNEGRQGR